MTDDCNVSFEQNSDSLYQKRYFSERSQNALPLNTSPDEKPVDATLKFDPGWNSFYSDLISTTTAEVALQQDMGVMIVPSNEALSRYWNDGAGKVLKEYYGTWENVPDLVVSKLINNNMLTSFVASVPSKFSTILDDASNPMNITEADIDTVFLGCNGAIYMSNKVFTPTSYASVSFPALINESMNIFYWAIEDLEYYAYLNSMDSYYSFIIPRNDALKNYVDPVSFGQSTTKIFKFYYDFEATSQNNKVKASIWSHNPETGMLDSLKMATYAEIRERLKDMLDYHIIIGDIESGNDYYMTKGGGTLKVENASMGEGNMKIYGGYQLEQGVPQIVSKIYDESLKGNGKTYIIEELKSVVWGRGEV